MYEKNNGEPVEHRRRRIPVAYRRSKIAGRRRLGQGTPVGGPVTTVQARARTSTFWLSATRAANAEPACCTCRWIEIYVELQHDAIPDTD
jgi:hypothetical protein